MTDKEKQFEHMAYEILEDYTSSYSKVDMDVLARYISIKFGELHAEECKHCKPREGKILETIKDGKSNRVFTCCGKDFTSLTSWIMPDFCPNCGARMTFVKGYGTNAR